ncbi:mechanosensitive ion channel domain-containing protein [uncultured Pontibacter sp.]|uniref:mechanosensitive ion channel family protein n=1 Tax=uncultured Pontibacter sp. TaxID=453356 RepID=UPI0026354D9E|nr:mechanosensitive ion channel domain-containing protein [uncultured Pontibacter sp.]
MQRLSQFLAELDHLALGLLIMGVAILVGLLVKVLLFWLLNLYNRKTSPQLMASVTRHLDRPLTFFIPLLFAAFVLSSTPFTPDQYYFFRRLIELLNIAGFGWILLHLVFVVQDMVRLRYNITKEDNIRERRLITQLQFIKKLSMVLISFITISLMLLSFEPVRKLGTGMLTSAGIAGIIVGFAAQRSLSNLLAGLQIAFSQPIRIDDVLVLEGEFGRVEEITLTYVVLRIWDNRRMVLPLNYFIEKPFQNWTRSSSDILATVHLYLDYRAPIEKIRAELAHILENTPLWDRQVQNLQVTDAKERTLELRVMVSAPSSGAAWDLRCHIREKLITFIQEHHPEALPKIRASLNQETISDRTQ